MKKPKQKKSPAQIAKEQAEKAAAKTAAWQRECRKLGISVRFSFQRTIKKAMDCEMDAVNSGEIEFVRFDNSCDVSFYRMKKNFPKSLEDK